MSGVIGGLRSLTGIGGSSGEEHQFEFVGAGTVLLQSSEMLMAEKAVGAVGAGAESAGVPGAGYGGGHGQQARWGSWAYRGCRGSWVTSSGASDCDLQLSIFCT